MFTATDRPFPHTHTYTHHTRACARVYALRPLCETSSTRKTEARPCVVLILCIFPSHPSYPFFPRTHRSFRSLAFFLLFFGLFFGLRALRACTPIPNGKPMNAAPSLADRLPSRHWPCSIFLDSPPSLPAFSVFPLLRLVADSPAYSAKWRGLSAPLFRLR